ncbi:MAG TPA: hydroxymethylglutaryl-CoA lyase [Segeticoccus sp.]|uniref:hydroxymethylglutaryl-CoA lyase n=1 Tax=Segeticoccus sp. TaxID=2706531 RepID=UPI002D7FFF2D|nr:hydroxymethylglutaryl-CoA lyase [Segeticoccus sp.]HET8600529.1 hydroxymethylglutaryl-CoA lyase [Segeticoccus sp.]
MRIELTEVVLRDGLQDQPLLVRTADKIQLGHALTDAGISRLEAVSFVHPAKVPQMADADEFMEAWHEPRVRTVGLALNRRGGTRAVEAGVDEVRVAVSASEGHSRANAGRPTARALEDVAGAVSDHPHADITVGIATAFVCPYDGMIPPQRLVDLVLRLKELGVQHVGLADTLGTATTETVMSSVEAVLEAWPNVQLNLHLHDGRGQALTTVDAAIEAGITRFDSSLAGIGGCPFAPGAAGNLDTATLVRHLLARGHDPGVDPDRLAGADRLLRDALARATPLESRSHTTPGAEQQEVVDHV